MDEEQFYAGDDCAADAEFYDGPTGDEGKPYLQLTEPRWLREMLAVPEPLPPRVPEPVWDKPLLTAEEFMQKYHLNGR